MDKKGGFSLSAMDEFIFSFNRKLLVHILNIMSIMNWLIRHHLHARLAL